MLLKKSENHKNNVRGLEENKDAKWLCFYFNHLILIRTKSELWYKFYVIFSECVLPKIWRKTERKSCDLKEQ